MDRGRARDRAGEPSRRDRRRRVAGPGPAPREQLEQDDPEAVDVGRGRRQLAPRLLGAEVVDRPERRARQRQRGLGQRPGDPEVGDLHPALAGHEDVAGLDVAMDEASVVRGADGARRLGDEARGSPRRERAAPPDDGGEVLALDQLHDDERPDRVGAEVVHRDDARMVQRRRGLGLVPEALDEVGVGAVLGPEDLDRDVALELVVAGPVDGRHAALSEQLDQPVPASEDGADVRQTFSPGFE